MTSVPWKLVVITGASGGLGRAIALAYVRNYSARNIHFVLSGRRIEELQITENEIHALRNKPETTLCTIAVANLAETGSLALYGGDLFDRISSNSYSDATFINNAGSLGPLCPIGHDMHTAEAFTQVFNLNVTSSCYLTSEFVRR
jgi:short-subunit dehydrogenase